jgi:hypothetical protein
VGAAPGATYGEGALYRDGIPIDAQLAFRLAYAPGPALLGLARGTVRDLGLLVVAAFLYVLPGWALLTLLWRGEPLAWPVKLGVAAGASLALYPLLMVWADVLGMRWGVGFAWLPPLLGAGALALRRVRSQKRPLPSLRGWLRSEDAASDLALLAALGLTFGARLLVVRGLEVPMWGDSYQHTVMAQLMLDRGGLFRSWLPYAPYESLTVHFGFPSLVAVLSWVTGLDSTSATVVGGQLINGLAILTIYPLAVKVARGDRWAGVGAVVVAGLLSPMPAFYVNWGRYAQLAGQAILPAALWLYLTLLESPGRRWGWLLLTGGVVTGMTLTYYRMPFYFAAFVAPWLLVWGVSRWRLDLPAWRRTLMRSFVVGGTAVLLFLPWLLNVMGGELSQNLAQGVSQASSLEWVLAEYRIWLDFFRYVPSLVTAMGVAGLAWGAFRRDPWVIVVGLWIALLSSFVAGQLLRVPGAAMMQNFAILIFFYVPFSLSGGWLVAQLANSLPNPRLRRWGVALGVVVLALWGARGGVGVVDASHILVRRPDLRAMGWIREQVPADAHFLVEGFRIYGGRSAVGSDAGWWIPLFTERGNTMPPQYALLNEVPAEPGYSRGVVDLVETLEGTSPASDEGLAALCEAGVTHVYVGQEQGEVGVGANPLFVPTELLERPEFQLLYREDRVHIFAVAEGACPGP